MSAHGNPAAPARMLYTATVTEFVQALSPTTGRLLVDALDCDPVSAWSLGASVLAPTFSGGRLTAQVDAAMARRDRAALAYRGATLTALAEVENAPAGTRRLRSSSRASGAGGRFSSARSDWPATDTAPGTRRTWRSSTRSATPSPLGARRSCSANASSRTS